MVDVNAVAFGASVFTGAVALWTARDFERARASIDASYAREAKRIAAVEAELNALSRDAVSLRQAAEKKASLRQAEALFLEAAAALAEQKEKMKLRAVAQNQ